MVARTLLHSYVSFLLDYSLQDLPFLHFCTFIFFPSFFTNAFSSETIHPYYVFFSRIEEIFTQLTPRWKCTKQRAACYCDWIDDWELNFTSSRSSPKNWISSTPQFNTIPILTISESYWNYLETLLHWFIVEQSKTRTKQPTTFYVTTLTHTTGQTFCLYSVAVPIRALVVFRLWTAKHNFISEKTNEKTAKGSIVVIIIMNTKLCSHYVNKFSVFH